MAVRWLLGPTYQKRLLHREIQARFTQLVNNRPSLTFWEPHRAQLDYLQPIYQGQVGNGRWWAQVGVETVDLHRHASLRDGLVRQAYQAGHQVAACPLVAHGRREWWPLTFERPVRWRLMILLALEQLPLGKVGPHWVAGLVSDTDEVVALAGPYPSPTSGTANAPPKRVNRGSSSSGDHYHPRRRVPLR